MDVLYQSLVAVNPVTFAAQICNLFLQMFLVKKLFLNKVLSVLDARREAADRELADAQTARAQALDDKAACAERMNHARAEADALLEQARKTAAARSEEILGQARTDASRIREKAAADIALEKNQALRDARDEISGISIAIAEKVMGRQLNEADHGRLIAGFIDELGDIL